MYNTKFKVKYNDIEKELMSKIDLDKECSYSCRDVLDVCNKLYRDEFLSVFGLEYFETDKINEMISNVYDKMMTNIEFKEIVDNISNFCFKDFFLKKEENEESIKKQIILTSLFSQNLFFITHKCVCQQIELGTIDKDLLVELKTHSIDIFTNQFV
jgi:hypothetical protein